MYKKSYLIIFLLFLSLISAELRASTRTMLPRFPEIVLMEGLSSDYIVTKCHAKAEIENDRAHSNIEVEIKNQSNQKVKNSIKYRILYPVNESQIRISANGKRINYNRQNPVYSFELEPGEAINFKISAATSINYSIDAVRNALRQEQEQQETRKRFALDDFAKLFSKERFGRRFMSGTIISKWGIFPIEIKDVSITLVMPHEFTLVSQNEQDWSLQVSSRSNTYRYNNNDEFSGAVFLPEADKEDFIKTQEILTSERFMH